MFFCFLAVLISVQQSFGQDKSDGGSVVTVITPHSSDGIFNSSASFTFQVTNSYSTPQTGKISYIVTTEAGKKVKLDSVKVNISKESTESHDFTISGLQPGFYKINFMINVSDYDDTTRKAFGIKPSFDQF